MNSMAVLVAIAWLTLSSAFEVTEGSIPENSWHDMPSMDTFSNYEEMQRYMDSMSSRRVEVIANPTMDSYITAYNLHHEIYQNLEENRAMRVKRSAQKTPPEFIKFEFADAKEPDDEVKKIVNIHREREQRSMGGGAITSTTPTPTTTTSTLKTAPTPRRTRQRQANKTKPSLQRRMDEAPGIDQSVYGSRRYFMYQRAPTVKVKKSIYKVPQDVQKAITYILKDNNSQQGNLKYVHDANLGKYFASYHETESQLQHKHPTPAVGSIKFVYVPVPSKAYSADSGYYPFEAAKLQPSPAKQYKEPVAPLHNNLGIIKVLPEINYVMEEVAPPALQPHQEPEVTHQASSHLAAEGEQNSVEHEFPSAGLQYGAKEEEVAAKQLLHYQPHQLDYSVLDLNSGQSHDDKLSVDQLAQYEHSELASLIGKSPVDQLNGLSYLIAKEMSNQIKAQRLKEQKPQDNRSPILFHPGGTPPRPQSLAHRDIFTKNIAQQYDQQYKDHKPITETAVEEKDATASFGLAKEEHQVNVVHITPAPPPLPSSYHHIESVALSPNYKALPVAHDDKDLQYASKYAFGYRVRDFHTGNDFGHKQNRDRDGVTRGQYHILLPDGRVQNVRYHADKSGFHADVSFETGH